MSRASRIAELFGDAVDLEPAERGAFLDAACGDDADLRREIEELLRHDTGPDAPPRDRPTRDDAATRGPGAASIRASGAIDAGRSFLGRFEIERVLGEGGMGIVYLAHDPRLSRRIALKLVKGGGSLAARARLMREAQAMARIAHPNVVAVHEVGLEADDVFIAMEYAEGETLAKWLAAPRTTRDILEAFLQAGRGLAAAHRAGLLHRDFKAQNVLVRSDGRVQVLDFGLARWAGDGGDEARDEGTASTPLDMDLTGAGALMGTPGTMSPEHFEGDVGPASDQWSFAAALYRALFRQPPFPEDDLLALRDAVLHGTPAKPPASDVSAEVEHAVLRGLARHPEDRFASLAELLDVLEGVLRRDPDEDATRFARQRRRAAAFIAGLALASMLALGVRTGFRYQLTVAVALFQSALGLGFLAIAFVVFRRSAFATAHNRRLIALFTVAFAGMTAHRAYALARDLAITDVLRIDALFYMALLAYGAFSLERWLGRGAAVVGLYLGLSFVRPQMTGGGFGVCVLAVAALSAWSWPVPRAA